MARPRLKASERPDKVMIRFTGGAGGSHYVARGAIVLRKGDSTIVRLVGHWAALVATGDAEIVE